MLILSATTDAIEVSTLEAHATNALQCVASWRDITSTTYTPGRSIVDTTGVTALDLVTGPDASTQRVIDTIQVENNDTKVHLVKVVYDANGTEYPLYRGLVGPDETLHYDDREGWHLTGRFGVEKSVLAGVPEVMVGGTGEWTTLIMQEDAPPNSSQTANQLRPLLELAVPVRGGQRYVIRYVIFYASAAATTGARFTINTPGFDTDGIQARGATTNAISTTPIFNEGFTGPNNPTAATAAGGTVGNFGRMDMLILPTNSGIVFLSFASEIASSAITPKKGSFVEYIAV
jgi:hypothetical protein